MLRERMVYLMAKVKINFQDSLLQKIEIIAAQSKVPRDMLIQWLCAQQLLEIQNKNAAVSVDNNIDIASSSTVESESVTFNCRANSEIAHIHISAEL